MAANRSTSGPAAQAGGRAAPRHQASPQDRERPSRDRWHALARRTEAGALATLIALGTGLAVASERAGAPTPPAAAAANEAAAFLIRVDHEVVRQLANGVTRIERWQETLARAGQTVWIERILPGAGGGDTANSHGHDDGHDHGPHQGHDSHGHEDHGHGSRGHVSPGTAAAARSDGGDRDQAAAGQAYRGHGHRHFDSDAAARWIGQGADGKVTLNLVDRKDRAIISIPRAEFRTLGFDGRFDGSASLVPASVVATMTVDPAAAPVTTPVKARWFVEASDGWIHRVLWSDAWQLALQIESRRDDGSVVRTVRVDPATTTTSPQVWPWQDLAGYERRRYDEYLD